MKNWTLRFRKVDIDRLKEIKNGSKRVETRAATVKYMPITKGDSITFVCGTERFKKIVAKQHHFKTASAMIKKIPLKHIMPDVNSYSDMKRRYASYPGYEEKIKKNGILAFELK